MACCVVVIDSERTHAIIHPTNDPVDEIIMSKPL